MAIINHTIVPDFIFKAGEQIDIDFNQYFESDKKHLLHYQFEDYPDFYHVEGSHLFGVTSLLAVDTPFLVTLIISEEETNDSQTYYAALKVLGSSSQEMAEHLNAELVEQIAKEVASYQEYDRALLLKQLEYIMSIHFPVVYIYDAFNPPLGFGELWEKRESESGFMIYDFSNCIVITSGDKAFAEFGNRARLLRTLEEVFTQDLERYGNWSGVGLSSTDLSTLNKAWIVARMLKVHVAEEAPSDKALLSYRALHRLVGDRPATAKRLTL